MSRILQFQDESMTKARDVLRLPDDLHIAHFPNLKPTEFLQNSYVLVKYRQGSAPTRVLRQWKGPHKVLGNGKSEYLLYDSITHKEKPYHASDMKPFVFNPLQTDPLDTARREYLEFFVEKFLDMTGDPVKDTTLRFLIKWLGFNDIFNSWEMEPWKNVRDVAVLHTYFFF
jgi:hypothetical protein